jgi:hypothetical protein
MTSDVIDSGHELVQSRRTDASRRAGSDDHDGGDPMTDTIARYLEFWNAETPEARNRLATSTFTADVRYHAPIGVLEGTDALIAFRDQLVGHIGPVRYEARERPDAHHDRARVRWELRLADDASFATGTDVLVVEPDGRVSSITGFLDRAPDGFDPDAHV